MKKIFNFVIASLFLVVISGCGQKKLICTYEVTEDYGKSTLSLTIKYDKEPTNVNMTNKVLFNEDKSEFIDAYYSSMTSVWEEYKDKDGFTISNNKKDLEISNTLEIDMTKIKDEEKADFSLNGSIDEIKKIFVDSGYTCK